jgi:Domain of unknown function (DUF6883)
MTWPPKPGETLPRAQEAVGVREKLAGYSLNIAHEDGRPKAQGFESILGVTIADLDYVEGAILAGVKSAAIGSVRGNAPYGVICVVDVALRGLGAKEDRQVDVRTVWELTGSEAPPRLVSAYLKP